MKVGSIVVVLGAFVLFLNACKKKEKEEVEPVRIQSVVPQSVIDDLRSRGMAINEGRKPPRLDLSVRVSPYELLDPYGPEDSFQKGEIAWDYFYKFYNQTDRQDITFDYSSDGTDEGSGQGAFIIGEDNQFTIFAEVTGVSYGIAHKTVVIVSGILDGTSIKNFQYAFLLTEKDEVGDTFLMPVNKSRIWIDADFVSESVANARPLPPTAAKKGTLLDMR
jgi:hypothetical protein